jgi:8-oxo-dGTP pyrophosphatase MutT (NUDIX family)
MPPANPSPSLSPEATPEAAVAIIRTSGADPEFLVLRRALNPEDPWSGHFALPGGRREKEDRDLLETCIRETREECGILLNPGQLVRELPWSSAGLASGRPTLVAPFLFEIPARPSLSLASLEIAEFHWLALSYLLDPANHGEASLSLRHPDMRFPFIRVGTGSIWGFTYGVLKILFPPPPGA